LVSDKTTIGRSTDPRFKSDTFLSPAHACLTKIESTIVIEDQTSLNGTFLRIKGAITIKPGDTFLMGRQVLQLHEMALPRDSKDDHGTRAMGSPRPDSSYQLIQVGVGNVAQNIFCLTKEGAIIGREEGDIRFAKDRFMSAKHGRIEIAADGSLRLLDLDSSNGLWVRLTRPTTLTKQDYLFMGQQLFRFHVSE
jgi:pSer/pThr/pTyr-binding forkhead associated (FHA) protein